MGDPVRVPEPQVSVKSPTPQPITTPAQSSRGVSSLGNQAMQQVLGPQAPLPALKSLPPGVSGPLDLAISPPLDAADARSGMSTLPEGVDVLQALRDEAARRDESRESQTSTPGAGVAGVEVPVGALLGVNEALTGEDAFSLMLADPEHAEEIGQQMAARIGLDEYLSDKLDEPVKITLEDHDGITWFAFAVGGEQVVISRSLEFPVQALDANAVEPLNEVLKRAAAHVGQIVDATAMEAAFPAMVEIGHHATDAQSNPDDFAMNDARREHAMAVHFVGQAEQLFAHIDADNAWLFPRVGARLEQARTISAAAQQANKSMADYFAENQPADTAGEVYDDQIQETEDGGGVTGWLGGWGWRIFRGAGSLVTGGGQSLDAQNARMYKAGDISWSDFKSNRRWNVARVGVVAVVSALTAGRGGAVALRWLGLEAGTLAAGVVGGSAEGTAQGFLQAFTGDVYAKAVSLATESPGVAAFEQETIVGPGGWIESAYSGSKWGAALGGASHGLAKWRGPPRSYVKPQGGPPTGLAKWIVASRLRAGLASTIEGVRTADVVPNFATSASMTATDTPGLIEPSGPSVSTVTGPVDSLAAAETQPGPDSWSLTELGPDTSSATDPSPESPGETQPGEPDTTPTVTSLGSTTAGPVGGPSVSTQPAAWRSPLAGTAGYASDVQRRGSEAFQLTQKSADWTGADEARFRYGNAASKDPGYRWQLDSRRRLRYERMDKDLAERDFDPATGVSRLVPRAPPAPIDETDAALAQLSTLGAQATNRANWLACIRAGTPALNALEDAALLRVMGKAPNLDHMRGALLEELAAAPLRQRARAAGEGAQFIAGSRITDATGRELSDGMVIRYTRAASTEQVAPGVMRRRPAQADVLVIGESKAGHGAAVGLRSSYTPLDHLKPAGLQELEGEAIEVVRERAGYGDTAVEDLPPEFRSDVLRANHRAELDALMRDINTYEAGQVDRDFERLMPISGESPYVKVLIDGEPTMVRVGYKLTEVAATVPTDVPLDSAIAAANDSRNIQVSAAPVSVSSGDLVQLARMLRAEMIRNGGRF